MGNLTVVYFGDIVGRPGRQSIHHAIPLVRERFDPDLIVANAENSAGGSGLTSSTMQKLASYGVEVFSTGDHFFRNKDYVGVVNDPRVLRPANYPKVADGKGWGVYEARGGVKVCVINLMGRIFMEAMRCPFEMADEILEKAKQQANVILVDFHAEATSEKVAMGWHLDGRVSAMVGTHTHIPTADERVLPNGTAYITDLGMSGPYDSVIGRDKNAVLKKLRTGMPARFLVADKDIRACGVIIKIDSSTGKATDIQRLLISLKQVDGKSKSSTKDK